MGGLVDRYDDLPLGPTDASVIAIAEREERASIAIATNLPFSEWAPSSPTPGSSPRSSIGSPSTPTSSRPAPSPTGDAPARTPAARPADPLTPGQGWQRSCVWIERRPIALVDMPSACAGRPAHQPGGRRCSRRRARGATPWRARERPAPREKIPGAGRPGRAVRRRRRTRGTRRGSGRAHPPAAGCGRGRAGGLVGGLRFPCAAPASGHDTPG